MVLGGCVIKIDDDPNYDSYDSKHMSWQQQEKQNKAYISDLELGVSSSKIEMALGTPDFNEAFKTDNGKVQILYYRTHHKESDSITTKDECTPLVFVNDELVGWGESAVKRFIN